MPKLEVKRIKYKLVVSLEVEPPVPASWVREYVKNAVEDWRGQLRPPGGYGQDDPGDPMWYLDPNTVKVSYVKKK